MGTKATGNVYLCSLFFVKKRETKGEKKEKKVIKFNFGIRNGGIFFPTGFLKIHVEIFNPKWYHEK